MSSLAMQATLAIVKITTTYTTTPFPAYTYRIPQITSTTTFRFYGYAPATGSYIDFTKIAFLRPAGI